jgi:uncharacterized membrane protein YesL
MNPPALSTANRIAVVLVVTIGLFIVSLLVFPDAVPVLPVAVAVPLWVTLFPSQRRYDARSRRVLWMSFALGLIALLAAVVLLLVVK